MYFLDDGLGFGGAAHTLLRQAVLMKNAGHKALLSISNYKTEEIAEEYLDICIKSDIEIIRLPFQISSQPEDIDVLSIIKNYTVVRDAVKNYIPDLIHSIQINPIVELVSREFNVPHIMNIYQIQECFFSIRYTDIFSRYHICDSWYYANIWKKVLHTDSTCIRTVANNPLSNNLSQRKPLQNKIIRYCCVGGIYTRKNQLEVIKAFEIAISEGLQGELYFYGYDKGSYADECKKYLVEKNLSKCVRIMGFYSTMEEEYEKADVLLCGSTCESYPNVISEALAHGLIVISTPVAGVPEVIRDGYNGYLCEDYSKTAIYRKIMQFDQERKSGKIEEVLFNANDTYRKVHSPESVSAALIKYYDHVLKDSRRTSEITIESIREKFLNIVKLYDNNYGEFVYSEIAQLKLWYMYHIKDVLIKLTAKKERKVYIWGAGRLAKTMKYMIEIFFPFLRIEGFIDNYKQGELFDLPIFRPEGIVQEHDNILFVGVTNRQEEILQTLQEYSRIYNQDYFVLTPRLW